MTISLYAASVPSFQVSLKALKGILQKADAHAVAAKVDASVYLQARLYPNMFPLVRQVQITCDFAKGCAARLAGLRSLAGLKPPVAAGRFRLRGRVCGPWRG